MPRYTLGCGGEVARKQYKGWIVYAVVDKVRVVIPLRYLPGLE